jgi:uncharacterized BrkB/YihY/UPF0761 family membrane protein
MNTKKLLDALYIIFSVFIIGLASPSLVSAFIALTTEAKFSECVETFPFWLFTVLGWIIGGVYVNDEV